jgi:hypothetical protein
MAAHGAPAADQKTYGGQNIFKVIGELTNEQIKLAIQSFLDACA